MNTQSEALRLARELEQAYADDAYFQQHAAELRRLHALNAELLEALKGVLVWGTDEDWKNAKIWCEKARAAIAKAEGEQA